MSNPGVNVEETLFHADTVSVFRFGKSDVLHFEDQEEPSYTFLLNVNIPLSVTGGSKTTYDDETGMKLFNFDFDLENDASSKQSFRQKFNEYIRTQHLYYKYTDSGADITPEKLFFTSGDGKANEHMLNVVSYCYDWSVNDHAFDRAKLQTATYGDGAALKNSETYLFTDAQLNDIYDLMKSNQEFSFIPDGTEKYHVSMKDGHKIGCYVDFVPTSATVKVGDNTVNTRSARVLFQLTFKEQKMNGTSVADFVTQDLSDPGVFALLECELGKNNDNTSPEDTGNVNNLTQPGN